MKVLITGGSGFIGSWLVDVLLSSGEAEHITTIDNFSNSEQSVTKSDSRVTNVVGNVCDVGLIDELFSKGEFDVCYHLATSINVQKSIDHPSKTFENDVVGTFNILEAARKRTVAFVLLSTAMIYDIKNWGDNPISEDCPTKALAPYSACKIATESLLSSYAESYGLKGVSVRLFNTYGPRQLPGGEGGVIPIFVQKSLNGTPIRIFGDGKQTRDFLYVEDAVSFLVAVGTKITSSSWEHKYVAVNAGIGEDISIRHLAEVIAGDSVPIEFIEHHHAHAEVARLVCDRTRAKELFGWEPCFKLEEGIARTKSWLVEHSEQS